MMVWTDERMDDLANRMDTGFERVDRDIRDLAARMDREFQDVRAQMDTRFERVDSEMQGIRSDIRGFGIALMVGLVGVIAALIGAIATGTIAG